jgi:hypothetical protein
LVNIVEDWKEMAEYVTNASRATAKAYQVIRIDVKENEIRYLLRVQVGKFGFQQEFSGMDDQILKGIMDYCRERRFLNVSRTVQDEDFFK